VEDPVTIYVTPPADKENIKPDNLLAREKKRAKEPDVIKDWRKRMAGEGGGSDEAASTDRAGPHRRRTVASARCWCAAWPRSNALRCGTRWPTIWQPPSGCGPLQQSRRPPHSKNNSSGLLQLSPTGHTLNQDSFTGSFAGMTLSRLFEPLSRSGPVALSER
jgi:hypothetical protein